MHYRDDLVDGVEEIDNLWIAMEDGVRLSARMWLPKDARTNPVPAILEYLPYRKGDHTAWRDSIIHRYFAAHGYACLRVDLRGSGDSEGVLADEYLQRELDDGCHVLKWIAAQPWCSGKVGVIGLSWGGFNGLQLAAMQPPELGAVISVCSTDDRYADDVHYMGGSMLTDNLAWASKMLAYTSLPPDPETFGQGWRETWLERLAGSGLWLERWLRHQRRDEYWKHGSICEDFEAIEVPVYAIGGWADGYSDAVLRMMEKLTAPKKGLIGPWSHSYPFQGRPGPAIGFLQECLRWWDCWLKGRDSGIGAEPLLTLWMQESVPPSTRYDLRPGRWITESAWPPPSCQLRSFRFEAGKLMPEGADASSGGDEVVSVRSPLSVGLYGGKWCAYSQCPDLPHDQREEDGGALVFESEALEQAFELLGAPELDLTLAADKPVAMLAVRLSDVNRDDEATRVTYGLLNLTHRDSHEHPRELTPNEPVKLRLRLHDIAYVFPKGHRLRISISTSYWPIAWPAPEPARLTLWPGQMRLRLPQRDPAVEAPKTPEFGRPEGAAPTPKTVLRPPRRNWWIVHDLGGNEVRLEVLQDEGAYRLEERNLTAWKSDGETYSFRGNAYDSLRAETRYERGLERESWSVRTVMRTVLTSDATHFHWQADIDAYENDKRVFARSWHGSVARDLV